MRPCAGSGRRRARWLSGWLGCAGGQPLARQTWKACKHLPRACHLRRRRAEKPFPPRKNAAQKHSTYHSQQSALLCACQFYSLTCTFSWGALLRSPSTPSSVTGMPSSYAEPNCANVRIMLFHLMDLFTPPSGIVWCRPGGRRCECSV